MATCRLTSTGQLTEKTVHSQESQRVNSKRSTTWNRNGLRTSRQAKGKLFSLTLILTCLRKSTSVHIQIRAQRAYRPARLTSDYAIIFEGCVCGLVRFLCFPWATLEMRCLLFAPAVNVKCPIGNANVTSVTAIHKSASYSQ